MEAVLSVAVLESLRLLNRCRHDNRAKDCGKSKPAWHLIARPSCRALLLLIVFFPTQSSLNPPSSFLAGLPPCCPPFLLLFSVCSSENIQAPQTSVPSHPENLGEQLLWRPPAEPGDRRPSHSCLHWEVCGLHRADRWVVSSVPSLPSPACSSWYVGYLLQFRCFVATCRSRSIFSRWVIMWGRGVSVNCLRREDLHEMKF